MFTRSASLTAPLPRNHAETLELWIIPAVLDEASSSAPMTLPLTLAKPGIRQVHRQQHWGTHNE